MSNKCPKCGAKLSPFYLKPNCTSCGVNIVQYGFDERLENDKIRAEKEWERFDNFLNGLKKASIGSVSYTHLDVYKRQNTTSLNIDNIVEDNALPTACRKMKQALLTQAKIIIQR